ncbi:MAG: DUF2092 domain-containing protein [Janthinobacterium lividum]
MPRFSYHPRQAILAGLALLTGPATAQAPNPVTPPAAPAPMVPTAPVPAAPGPAVAPPVPAAPPPAAVIDPHVSVLFDQAIAAHQALKALSATIAVTSSGIGPEVSQTITLSFQKPNEVRIAVSGAAGPIVQLVSNGKMLIIYSVHDKKYRVQPVPAGANIIPAVLIQARGLLPRLIGQPEALGELLAQPGVSVSLGTAQTVGSVPTDTVNAVLPAPDGSSLQLTFAIGTSDHLIRRVSQSATVTRNGATQTFLHTETITSLVTAPVLTASDFVFTPPPGVTKIAPVPPPAPAAKLPLKKAPAAKLPLKKAPAAKLPLKKAPAAKLPLKKAPAAKLPLKKTP